MVIGTRHAAPAPSPRTRCVLARAPVATPGGCALLGFLRAHRLELVLGAIAAVAKVLDLLLDARDFGIDFVERALRGVHRVRSAVVAGTQLLDPLFGVAQAARSRLPVRRPLLSMSRPMRARCAAASRLRSSHSGAAYASVAPPGPGSGPPSRPAIRGVRAACPAPGGCLPRAAGSRACRRAAARFRARRSRYFETPAASSRKLRRSSGLRLDDARDHALLDDGVAAAAEAGAEEDVGDIAPAHVHGC